MRHSALFIAISLVLLASCGVVPNTAHNNRAELDKVPGPNVGSIEGTLKAQAQQAISAGDYVRAAQIYKQLFDKAPDNPEYALGLAINLRRAHDDDTSLKVTEDLLKKDSSNVEALENKGLVLMDKGEFTEASRTFEDVMKIDPKRWRTLNAIGILFTIKNKQSDAIAYYEEALNQNPDNASILNNEGLTYAMDRQFDKAYQAFDDAKRHLPSDSPEVKRIDLNLALVYAVAGRLDDAQATATPHLSKAALYNNMGFYAYLAKNRDLARGYLNMALTQSPTYYERAWKNLQALNGEASNETSPDEEASTPASKLKSHKKKTDAEEPQADATPAPVPSSTPQAQGAEPVEGFKDMPSAPPAATTAIQLDQVPQPADVQPSGVPLNAIPEAKPKVNE